MKKKKKVVVLLILILLGVGIWFMKGKFHDSFAAENKGMVLYGNVDNRQVQLSFQLPERILELYPEEGTLVRKGEMLGSLDPVRIENEIMAAKATIDIREASLRAAESGLKKIQNGTRIEYIAMAKAGLAALNARYKNAQIETNRSNQMYKENIITKREQEKYESEYQFYKGAIEAVQSMLARLIKGELPEDIDIQQANVDRARAELLQAQSNLKILEQKLADTKLYAPDDGIIQNRIHEPGEMVSPQAPVLTMSVISPKWVRTYIRERDLMKVRIGDMADLHFDGAEQVFQGRIGYISSSAEFTPKNIETEELRSNLVYEVRIYVEDKENLLKLGAPATITFPDSKKTDTENPKS